MNKYRRLLGSSRGSHFKESKRKFKFSSARRRQTVRFRSRYAKSIAQKISAQLWTGAKVIFILGVGAWVASIGVHMARETKFLEVKSVVYEGDVPLNLQAFIPINSGQNIFSIEARRWEKEAKDKFSEISEITIHRSLTRDVVIRVTARVPIATTVEFNRVTGVDEEGVQFPLSLMDPASAPKLPIMEGRSKNERGEMGKFLVTLKSESPELFSELEGLSLKEGALELRLTNGILIDWGPIDEKNIFDKAKNILRLLHQYTPVRVPAKMSFVTAERIVMDSNWK